MKLIVGLGNPGREYTGTRHNLGYDVVDELARRSGLTFHSSRHRGLTADGVIGATRSILLKPITYMNRSGEAVRALVDYYDIDTANILVVCDCLDLETGDLRLRGKGSSGGHKGLKDLERQLHTQGFARLRIGIGRPSGGTVDYVLGLLRGEEKEKIDVAKQLAADACVCWLTEGLAPAMNRYNRKPSAAQSGTLENESTGQKTN